MSDYSDIYGRSPVYEYNVVSEPLHDFPYHFDKMVEKGWQIHGDISLDVHMGRMYAKCRMRKVVDRG